MSDWREKILSIADGWMFDDVTTDLPSLIIIPFENPDYFNWEIYYAALDNIKIYKSIVTGFYRNKSIGILKSKFGSAAVCFASHLLANRGVKKIIGIGYCGGIHPDYVSGNIILPTSVSRVSCTSRRYLPIQADIEANKILLNKMMQTAKSRNIMIYPSRAYSSDDLLLETTTLIRTLYDSGIHAIDMECGSLYTMGSYFKIETAALLVLSDNALTGEPADYEKVSAAIQESILLSLDVLSEDIEFNIPRPDLPIPK